MKERLVGAIVLVAAAIVFLPMILSGPESPPDQTVTQATDGAPASQRDDQFASRIASKAPDPSPVSRPTRAPRRRDIWHRLRQD